jgi:hypothetical protein
MAASAEAFLLFVAVASNAASHGASARRPRLARSKTMEATIRVLSIKELLRLTRVQLIGLHVQITNALPDMPEGSESRQIALINLRNIRIVQARHDLKP